MGAQASRCRAQTRGRALLWTVSFPNKVGGKGAKAGKRDGLVSAGRMPATQGIQSEGVVGRVGDAWVCGRCGEGLGVRQGWA